MNQIKFILRLIFFLLTISMLVYLNRKAEDDSVSIAEFKIKTFQKIRPDSLDSKHKFDLLLNETTKFVENSSHVQKGIRYLIALVLLWSAVELTFVILEKRNYGQQQTD